MDLATAILTIAGLVLFETITSIDNAIINAEVLNTLGAKAKRWFLTWGMFISVFLIRFMLPWLIVYLANPSLGLIGALTATFSADPAVVEEIEESTKVLLIGGGTFLVLLFFSWLFLDTKYYGLSVEKYVASKAVWFYAVVSILLVGIVWFALGVDPMMTLAACIGSMAFFIVHGFRQNAEEQERRMLGGDMSDTSKLFYLEVVDATFSIDSVVGAFAFTMSVPLIMIGCGIGALIVRKITVSNTETVKKYHYLKNGAMYSIFFLGSIMILDSFGVPIPGWVSPVITFAIVGYFFWRSVKEIKNTTPAG